MQIINLQNNDYCLINEKNIKFKGNYAVIKTISKNKLPITGIINKNYEDCFKNNVYASYLALNSSEREILQVTDNDFIIILNCYDEELDIFNQAIHLKIKNDKIVFVNSNLPGMISFIEHSTLIKTKNFLYDVVSCKMLGTYHDYIDNFHNYYLNEQNIKAAWVTDKINISNSEEMNIEYLIDTKGKIISNQIYLKNIDKFLNIELQDFDIESFTTALKSKAKIKKLNKKKEVKPS